MGGTLTVPRPRPPRPAVALLERLLPRDAGEGLLGDLEERFCELAESAGTEVARRWYWREALRAPLSFAFSSIISSFIRHPGPRERPMSTLLADCRYALRVLWRRKGFAAAAILTLALGIGATTGVFSVVYGVLLKPLPYPSPERLVRIFEMARPEQGGGIRSVAIPTLLDWRNDLRSFEELALYGPNDFDIAGDQHPEKVNGANATGSLFTMLGATPQRGRLFTPEEERPGGPLAILLSDRFWRQRLNGDPAVVGRTLRLNRQAFTVIGVMRPGFAYPSDVQLWASLAVDGEYEARGARHMSAIGRLKPGVTVTVATEELLEEQRRLGERHPEHYRGYGARLIPLRERIVGGVRPTLIVLAGAVVLVLILACVNVANLLLAHALTRRREMAMRTALGASRGRVVQQLFAEAMMLFAGAGALGLVLAAGLVRAVHAFGAGILPRSDAVQLDSSMLLFALGLTAVTGLAFGLVPALQASGSSPAASLLEGGRSSSDGVRGGRMRAVLIATETALAALLLVGAGLLVRSTRELSRVDTGFPLERVLTFGIGVSPDMEEDRVAVVDFFRRAREAIAAVPGVRGVAMSNRLPLSGADHSNSFRLGSEPPDAERNHTAQDRVATPGYFRALGIPVTRGREFTERDDAAAPPVVIINETLSRRYFPDRDPLGERLVPSRAGGVPREIVGVVADTRQFGLELPAEPEFYIPHPQDPWPWLSVAVRTAGDPRALLPQVQQAVWGLDREMPLSNVSTMEEMTAESGAQRRFITLVLSLFAGMAYILTAVGLYGVIAYTVAQRTSEIGIRMALGAQRTHIARMVVGRGMLLAGAGVLAGLGAAVPLSRALQGMLYGVTATDPMTFVAIAVLLPAVALVACLLPARRALRVDPVSAMRSE